MHRHCNCIDPDFQSLSVDCSETGSSAIHKHVPIAETDQIVLLQRVDAIAAARNVAHSQTTEING